MGEVNPVHCYHYAFYFYMQKSHAMNTK